MGNNQSNVSVSIIEQRKINERKINEQKINEQIQQQATEIIQNAQQKIGELMGENIKNDYCKYCELNLENIDDHEYENPIQFDFNKNVNTVCSIIMNILTNNYNLKCILINYHSIIIYINNEPHINISVNGDNISINCGKINIVESEINGKKINLYTLYYISDCDNSIQFLKHQRFFRGKYNYIDCSTLFDEILFRHNEMKNNISTIKYHKFDIF